MQTTNSAGKTATTARPRDSRGHFIKRGGGATLPPRLAPARLTIPATPTTSTEPKALDPTPPVLSLFRHGEIAVLRIHDLAFSGVVSAVVRSLPPDVTSLMLVTPTDTKMFAVNIGGGRHAAAHEPMEVEPPARANQVTREDDGAGEDYDPQAEAIRSAAEGDREVAEAGLEEASAQIDLADTPAARRKAMNELRRAEAGAASDPCGRCGGSGQMQVAMPDGGATQAACPVCRGSGAIRRFGVRR